MGGELAVVLKGGRGGLISLEKGGVGVVGHLGLWLSNWLKWLFVLFVYDGKLWLPCQELKGDKLAQGP